MRQRLHEAHRKQDGFTLIELLIVIVILGVLAGIVVIAVGAFDDRGRTAACQADKRAVQVAVEAYYLNEEDWPATIDVLLDPDGDLDPSDGYLREAPSTSNGYVISVDPDTGEVSGDIC